MIRQDQGLKKEIGVWGLTANIINIMIGAGIFALPAIIAGKMGPSSLFAYVFCGILIMLVVLCFAEAGSKVNSTGGPYTYIETAFGNYAGFIAGIIAVTANIFASAAVANALLDVLATLNPNFDINWFRTLILLLLYLTLAFINIVGVKQGIGLIKLNTILKITPLLLLAFIGWKDVSWANLQIDSLPTIDQMGESSLELFFAFLGCEVGLIVGGEIKNPKRTVPRSIFIAIGSVVILYILIQTVSQGVLGSELPSYQATPLAEVARVVMGPLGYILLIVGASISMFGLLSGDMLNSPRVLFALSRDNVLPIKILSRIHNKFATPHIAILVYSILAFLLAATSSFKQLLVLGTCFVLIIYFGVALSVIGLRKKVKTQDDEFKIPGGWIVPILSMGIILYFLSNLSKKEMIGTVIFIAVLTILFIFIKVSKKLKR